MDRRAILACRTATDLFGEAADDERALRRAYAKLAKTWRDDREVATHVRSLYEAARDPTPAPDAASPEARLIEAVEAGDPQAIWDVIEPNAPELIARVPGGVLRGLWILVVVYGAHLSPEVLDRVEVLLREPTWEIDPERLSVLIHRVTLKRELLRAEADANGPPEPLLRALNAAWGSRPDAVMAIWLQTARALDGTDLRVLFEDLERRWPALVSAWSAQEWSMLQVAESEGGAPEGLEELRTLYPPLHEIERDVDKALERETSYPVQVSLSLLLLLPLSSVFPFWAAVLLCYVGRVALLVLWAWLVRDPRIQQRENRVLDRSVAPLLDFARRHALLPRELATHLVDLAEVPPGTRSLSEAHPLVRLDRSDTALLQVVTEAHVARMERIVEASDG